MPISLSGKKIENVFHLTGKKVDSTFTVPTEIQSIKASIIEMFILPLTLKKWSTFKENCFFIETFKKKIDFYYNRYKIDDILLYKDILTIIEFFNDQMVQLEDLEKKINNPLQDGQFGAMIYKTTMIKLKTEYVLYDNILGKPLRIKNQTYNQQVIKDIQKMLESNTNNMNYTKIRDSILSKYGMLVNNNNV